MICVEGSSLILLSYFRISKGSLEGIVSHDGLWEIEASNNHDKSSNSNIARKGNNENEYWEGGEVFDVPNGSSGHPILVLLEGWGSLEE
jgi:hypothetical protein